MDEEEKEELETKDNDTPEEVKEVENSDMDSEEAHRYEEFEELRSMVQTLSDNLNSKIEGLEKIIVSGGAIVSEETEEDEEDEAPTIPNELDLSL